MKTLEFTAKYKTGTGHITCKTTVAARNVTYIQEVPPETPEYRDGMISTISMGLERVMCVDPYETLAQKYAELMENEA